MQVDLPQVPRQRITAEFYVDPVHGPVCRRKLGPEAGADTLIEKINAEHVALFPVEHERFLRSRASVAPVGKPLRLLGIRDETIRLLNTHGVMDIETLAALEDSRMAMLMPGDPIGGVEIRDRARLVVPEDRRTPPAAFDAGSARDAEMAALRAELALSRAREAEALAIAEAATMPVLEPANEPEDEPREGEAEAAGEGQVRRGPGRPRRAA